MSLLMWGVVYQGYNAVFPSFYPELFPTRTRVSAMAISQNIGTADHRAAAGAVRRRGASGRRQHPAEVGAIALRRSRVIAAIAACRARETYRVHMNDLGNPNAVPVPKAEYDRLREQGDGRRQARAPTPPGPPTRTVSRPALHAMASRHRLAPHSRPAPALCPGVFLLGAAN